MRRILFGHRRPDPERLARVFVLGDMTIFSAFFSVFTSELANYVHSRISPLAGERYPTWLRRL